ncbi:hypothetical protein ACFVT2_14960 [Streptomyces sp. NPDC058000]|uniref:hypothetical protein n=1 Tax=Streptomyces sp. NPDC058000 TaxID=3346299 RepID=UPI0036EC877F
MLNSRRSAGSRNAEGTEDIVRETRAPLPEGTDTTMRTITTATTASITEVSR